MLAFVLVSGCREIRAEMLANNSHSSFRLSGRNVQVGAVLSSRGILQSQKGTSYRSMESDARVSITHNIGYLLVFSYFVTRRHIIAQNQQSLGVRRCALCCLLHLAGELSNPPTLVPCEQSLVATPGMPYHHAHRSRPARHLSSRRPSDAPYGFVPSIRLQMGQLLQSLIYSS